jgi:hypothetical protein
MSIKRKTNLLGTILAWATILSLDAQVQVRHFSVGDESHLLIPGERAVNWESRFRFGHDTYYAALDERLDVTLGLSRRFQLTFILDGTWETRTDTAGAYVYSQPRPEFSIRLKAKILDPVSNILGLSYYEQVGVNLKGFSAEGRLIADKETPWVVVALNLGIHEVMDYAVASNAWNLSTALFATLSGGLKVGA